MKKYKAYITVCDELMKKPRKFDTEIEMQAFVNGFNCAVEGLSADDSYAMTEDEYKEREEERKSEL